LDDGVISFGGEVYRDPRHALAVRLPASAKPTWVVSGYRTREVTALADRVLMAASGVRFHRSRKDFDYWLFENPWLGRRGRWQQAPSGPALDPEEEDGFAVRDAAYARLRTIRLRHVRLRVPADDLGDDACRRLAHALDAAAAAMAARVPMALREPIDVVVETDFESQGRHLGAIGETVLGPDGTLHLVYQPEDLDAYRHGLARLLVRRAGLASSAPWLEDGAALWLSEDWLGRPYRSWLPAFAAARVLPTPRELLAAARQDDASTVLWTPVAADVVRRLEGETLREKLSAMPSLAAVRQRLDEIAGLPAPAPMSAGRSLKPFINGVSLAMANGLEIGYHASGVDAQLARLAALGADAVSVMPFGYQPIPDEPQLRFLN
ncbi:MAG: hypothetical protein GY856_30075, partial [bacterium]|nr:hypothetical protein [bacterium]